MQTRAGKAGRKCKNGETAGEKLNGRGGGQPRKRETDGGEAGRSAEIRNRKRTSWKEEKMEGQIRRGGGGGTSDGQQVRRGEASAGNKQWTNRQTRAEKHDTNKRGKKT